MRLGFWVTVVLGVLGLAAMLISPVLGFLQAVLFFAAAWGIRRAQPWAAMVALAMVVAPTLAILIQLVRRPGPADAAGLAVPGLLIVAAAALLARTATVLFRRRGAGLLAGSDWAAAVFVVLVFLASFSLRPYVMPTSSMANTLLAGDRLLVDVASPALGWTPKRNDLVVHRAPQDPAQTYVKRVVAVPGDRIRLRDKQLLRNGARVEEPWVTHATSYTDAYRDSFPEGAPPPMIYPRAEAMLAQNVRGGELVVPEGQLFVLGDSRDNSFDSRYFGLVPWANVIGRPLVIYGSFDQDPSAVALGALPDLRRARWNRMFRWL